MTIPRLNAAFYAAPVSEFLAASDEEAYAPLAAAKGYTLAPEQLSAWHLQLPMLRAAVTDLPAGVETAAVAPAPWIHLKFDIPWLESVRTAFTGWDVFISPQLTDSEYVATGALARLTESRGGATAATFEPALHLATSMRSFRAESLSRFVEASLDGEAEAARELLASFREQYPIVLTRSMQAARRWINRQRRGTKRAGLVASSSAQRLKPHAIDIRVNIDHVQLRLDARKLREHHCTASATRCSWRRVSLPRPRHAHRCHGPGFTNASVLNDLPSLFFAN